MSTSYYNARMASLKNSISTTKLREAFNTDLRTVWNYVKTVHADKKPYAFVLYGVEDVPQLFPQVLT